ncbi:MAG: FtsX-like permease family protein [Luteitalea sp.]|nr:FtsX-like permease family protein [Luteitalea sp.]
MNLIPELSQDLRYAFRTLVRSKGWAAAVVVTLALGIGANTAIFSLIDAVLLQPLPYPEPNRLVRVLHHPRGDDVTSGGFSREDFADLKRDTPAYASLAAYTTGSIVMTGGGEALEINSSHVSADFFGALGVGAALGRTFRPEEVVPGADRVVVLSEGFWRRRFGADAGIVGKTMTLDGAPFTIVGVMPRPVDFPEPDEDIWIPISRLGCNDTPCNRANRFMRVVARLAPGATLATATSATNLVLERLEQAYPETNRGWGQASVITLHESLVGNVRPALLVLFGAVGLVLLIACANVANLLIVRGTTRGRELAIRAAVGAGRARVVRQLLTESVVLALVGGALGLALAVVSVDALVALGAEGIPRSYEVQPDVRVAIFAVVASLITGVAFGLLPSLTVSRIRFHDSLSAGRRSDAETGRHQLGRRLLIVGEMALAVVLLTGAGLLIKSFWNLTRVETGLRTENVLSLSVKMDGDVMRGDRRNAYRREIIRRIGNLPGVLAVGGSKDVPLHGASESYSFSLPGPTDVPPIRPGTYIVTGAYFRALGIPLIAGRVFTAADEVNKTPVVILNQMMARRYWPNRDPVSERLRLFDEEEVRIVGVVGDVRHGGITEAIEPAIYVLPHFGGRSSLTLFVRTASDPLSIAASVRQVIWDVNPDQPASAIMTMQQVVSETVREPRFFTTLLAAFAGLAVALAAIGVYGVNAFAVNRRRYEVGIRMALGAEARDVLRLFIRQGMWPVLGGLAIGLMAARALTRLLSGLLYGVDATDPMTFTGVTLVLLVVALLAVFIPAQRATRVDPTVALRDE